MKRLLMLLLLVVCCLVMTACNYPVSHRTEASAVQGSGVLHIDYAVEADQQKAFNSAVSYELHDNGAKLYIYKEGTFNSSETLGTGSVAELDTKDALSFLHTGDSSYRLTVRYSGLEEGRYEIHWDCNFSTTSNSCFYFTALDAEGNELDYPVGNTTENRFFSYDYYLNGNQQENIVFSVEAPVETAAPTSTPFPTAQVNPPAPPQTGDNANPLLWGCVLVMGAAGFVMIHRKKAHG